VVDILAKVREAHERLLSLGTYADALERWKQIQPALEGVGTIADLIDLCRQPGEERYQERDRVVATLCMLAATDETAKTLLLGLFLPGLIDLANTCAKRSVVPVDELHAELLANFWTASRSVDADTTKVARRLLNGARWRTARTLGRAVSWSQREEQVSDVELLYLNGRGSSDETQGEADGDWEDVLGKAVQEGVIGEVDAELVVATWGTLKDVSARYEIALGRARQRRRVAKERVRGWIEGTTAAPESERTHGASRNTSHT
jgi:hypothetical protein